MNVNVLLMKHKISKYKLSKLTKVPYSTINDICNGITTLEKCNAKTVYAIATFFGVSMEDLMYSEFV